MRRARGRSRGLHTLPAVGVVLVVLVATAAAADDKSQAAPPKEPAVFGSSVSLVSLPVFVVDGDGRALRGLQPGDFELQDDGKRVPVVSFQYVDTTSVEEQEAIREAPSARRHFLLLFDLSFSEVGGVHRAREAARDFLRRRLAASDLAAVATFDINRGIRIIANFTEDRALLVHAVDTLGVPALTRINDPLALARSPESTDTEVNVGRLGSLTTDIVAAGQAAVIKRLQQAQQDIYRRQVFNLVANLEELGRALRGVEGRKQVIYFSAGFDSHIITGSSGKEMKVDSEALVAGRSWEVDSLSRYGDNQVRSVLAEMTRTLANADCVIHSVDVTGLGTDRSLTRTEAGDPGDSNRDTSGRDSLSFLAAETGGRFFKDTNDLGSVLGELTDMTSRYYILGYEPPDLQGPGRFHKLKVKVRRRGARVSHRGGFYEHVPRAAQTTLQRKFESAQLVVTGAGPSSLHFRALCLPFPAPGDRQTLGIVLQVPKDEVVWSGPLSLEVFVYAVAQDGTVLDHLAQLVRIDPAQADAAAEALGISLYGTLQVPPGSYTIRMMVQEGNAGTSGVQFIDVAVPPHDPRVGFLLPPVLMDETSRWIGLDMGTSRPDRPAFPFAISGRPFVPRASFRVEAGATEKLVVMAFDPTGPVDRASSGLEIQSSVTDASGRQVPPGLLRIDKVLREAGGKRTYVFAYTPDRWEPGDYTLRIGVGEAGSQLQSYTPLHMGAAAANP